MISLRSHANQLGVYPKFQRAEVPHLVHHAGSPGQPPLWCPAKLEKSVNKKGCVETPEKTRGDVLDFI